MKKFIENHLIVSLSLFLIAGALILGAWVADSNQSKVEGKILEQIVTERNLMLQLATLTDHNGADETISRIVSDCSRRTEYEDLLTSLESLSKKDLIAAQNLFESCGKYYTERKALMVAKLEREFEIYTTYVAILKEFHDDKELDRNTDMWKDLISLENDRSSFLSDQNHIQAKIISLLISGSVVSSKELVELIRDAGEINELLGVSDHKIDALRASLTQ
ncbi:MAG: hypothetical protein WAW13_04960 [Minisyncoccia bacterium]